MGNGFELRQNQEVIQEEKVQILCRCVSVDSTGYVFADMNLKKKGGELLDNPECEACG
jgi:hypothetical protein